MIHQLRSKTAPEIFSHPSMYYHVDYKRETVESFQAKLKFPGDTKYSKFAPILFPGGIRTMKKIFWRVELTKVAAHYIFPNLRG